MGVHTLHTYIHTCIHTLDIRGGDRSCMYSDIEVVSGLFAQ